GPRGGPEHAEPARRLHQRVGVIYPTGRLPPCCRTVPALEADEDIPSGASAEPVDAPLQNRAWELASPRLDGEGKINYGLADHEQAAQLQLAKDLGQGSRI